MITRSKAPLRLGLAGGGSDGNMSAVSATAESLTKVNGGGKSMPSLCRFTESLNSLDVSFGE